MDLTKDNANKITCINQSKVVTLPEGVFSQGDMLMLFNNSDDFICLESRVEKTYQSGQRTLKTMIGWPPRSLMNVVFVDADLAVVTVELT